MMTANFTGNNYAEALKFLSSTIGYFQRIGVPTTTARLKWMNVSKS